MLLTLQEVLPRLHPLIQMQLKDFIAMAHDLGGQVISSTHFSAVCTALPTDDPMQQLVIAHDMAVHFASANYITTIKEGNIIDTHYVTVQYKLPYSLQ